MVLNPCSDLKRYIHDTPKTTIEISDSSRTRLNLYSKSAGVWHIWPRSLTRTSGPTRTRGLRHFKFKFEARLSESPAATVSEPAVTRMPRPPGLRPQARRRQATDGDWHRGWPHSSCSAGSALIPAGPGGPCGQCYTVEPGRDWPRPAAPSDIQAVTPSQ